MKKIYSILLFKLLYFSGQAQISNALDFDGVDDQVIVPAASTLIAGSNQISISCWVYPVNAAPVFPDFDGFCGFRNDTNADFYIVQIDANKVEARFRNSTGTAADILYNGLDLNTWNNFVFTYDGTKTRLYHNGEIVDSTSITGTITNSNVDFLIGNLNYLGTDYWLSGKMDEVSIWNKTLSASEIMCMYSRGVDITSIGLQAYYTFNQGTGDGDNTSITTLTTDVGSAGGYLTNLDMTGPASNFVAGKELYTTVSTVLCNGTGSFVGSNYITTPGTYWLNTPPQGSNQCDSLVQFILFAPLPIDTSVSESGPTLTANQNTYPGGYTWVDCNNGYSPVVPQTISQSYTPTAPGNYAVVIWMADGCNDTSACHHVASVGLSEENTDATLELYPNPITSTLNLRYSQIPPDSKITISDIQGKIIETISLNEKKSLTLSTDKWNSGVYLLKMENEKFTTTRKFVKL